MSLPQGELKDIKGLLSTEAAERLKRDGYNELPASRKRNIFAIALEVLKEPMFLLLESFCTL